MRRHLPWPPGSPSPSAATAPAPRAVAAVLILLTVVATPFLASTARAQSEDTLLWLELRGGMGFFNDIDPDPLEELATALSSARGPITEYRPVEFVDKEWAFPFDVRLGMRLGDSVNAWLFYERLPYLLENDFGDRVGARIPLETFTLNIPANVFGAGFDFRLGTEGYGRSILLGFGGGRFTCEGDDEDIQGFSNYEISGSGVFWEVQAMAELEFTTEMSFFPFVAFRAAKTDEATASVVERPSLVTVADGDIPPFEIDYTGVTVGLTVRFRIYPFGVVGDPDRADDD